MEKDLQDEEFEFIFWQIVLAALFNQPFDEVLEQRLREVISQE